MKMIFGFDGSAAQALPQHISAKHIKSEIRMLSSDAHKALCYDALQTKPL
jgi:hypothetical protein